MKIVLEKQFILVKFFKIFCVDRHYHVVNTDLSFVSIVPIQDIRRASTTSSIELVPVQKNGNLIGKSLEKIKETSTVWTASVATKVKTLLACGNLVRESIASSSKDRIE